MSPDSDRGLSCSLWLGSVEGRHDHQRDGQQASLNRAALQATVHCLTGCAIGEILGMVIATALGLSNTASIALQSCLRLPSGTRSRCGQ